MKEISTGPSNSLSKIDTTHQLLSASPLHSTLRAPAPMRELGSTVINGAPLARQL
jgi:hypothetical protein